MAEYALLRDKSYELKTNGEPYTQTKFLRLPDNLRFSVKVFNRLFKADMDLNVGTASWDHFLEALKVRHRITHPKSVRDYEISADEIALCKDVTSWFNEIVHAAVRAIVAASEKHKTDVEQRV